MNEYWLFTKKILRKCRLVFAVWFRENEPYLRDRAIQYARLMRIDKPQKLIGSFLLLWPTLWALWIASDGLPTAHLIFVFIAGVFITRSAGCIVNDYADRNFDRHVARTSHRPLTTGSVSTKEALYLIVILLIIAFLLVLTTNRLTIILSFFALPLGGIYPFMKRYTYMPQLFLGMAFGWGIPLAFAAAGNSVPQIAWLIYIANILWSMCYDTMYAMVDREYDKNIGVKSTAILFEDSDRAFIGIIQVMMLMTFIFIGKKLEFGGYYSISLIVVTGIIVYHQYLIKDRKPELCFKAFLNNNWIGAVVFAGIVLNYYNAINL